ncbi:MAG: hypothetical protein V4547_07995 [Bacteroidota bacterium]
MLAPVPAEAPPQEAVYQFQAAPEPNEPPTTVSVVGPPQVVLGLAVADAGSTDNVLNVTVTCAHVEVPHPPPSALMK